MRHSVKADAGRGRRAALRFILYTFSAVALPRILILERLQLGVTVTTHNLSHRDRHGTSR